MNKLKFYREKKGLSQEELAKKSGVSRVSISKIENDKAKDIKIGTLKSLAAALDEPVQNIFLPEC